jgi:hypothetical protein
MRRVFFAVLERMGRDANIDSKFPNYFRKSESVIQMETRVNDQFGPLPRMRLEVYHSLFSLALKFGITTDEKSKAVIESFILVLEKGLWLLATLRWSLEEKATLKESR